MGSFWGLVILAFLSGGARAEELDKAILDAILETQSVIKDPAERKKAATTAEAKAATAQVESLGGNAENSEAIFALAAEIFADLAKSTNGDPKKMEEVLEKAKRNPAEFAERLSPAVKAKLKEISLKVPKGGGKPLP